MRVVYEYWDRLKSLRLRKFCTCGSLVSTHRRDRTTSRHYLNCDLMYRSNFTPRKKKQFIFFYPLVKR